MKFTLILILLLLLSSFSKQSQGQFEKRQGFEAELGGTGGFFSLNYEQRRTDSRLRFRGGISVLSGLIIPQSSESKIISIPIALLIQPKRESSQFIFGPGLTFLRYSYYKQPSASSSWTEGGRRGDNFFAFTFRLGYRSELSENGIYIGLSATPGYILNSGELLSRYNFIPWAGVSVGKAF